MTTEPPTFRSVIREAFIEHAGDLAVFIRQVNRSVKLGLPEQLIEAARSELREEQDPLKVAWIKNLIAHICLRKQEHGPVRSILKHIPDDDTLPDQTRAQACNYLAIAAKAEADFDTAMELCRKGLAFYGDDLDPTRAQLSNILGTCHIHLGNYEDAVKLFSRAIEERKKLRDEDLPVGAYTNLAIAYTRLGKPDQALEVYLETLKLAKKTGVKSSIAFALSNIASLLIDIESFEKAHEYAEIAFKTLTNVEDNIATSAALLNLTLANMHLDKLKDANDLAEKAVVMAQSSERKAIIAETRLIRGIVHAKLQEPEAGKELGDAIEYGDEVSTDNPPEMMEFALIELGKILCSEKSPEGYPLLKRAEKILKTRAPLPLIVNTLVSLKTYVDKLPASLK